MREALVSDTGEIARVLVLESSGNADVDNYYDPDTGFCSIRPALGERGRDLLELFAGFRELR